MNKDKQLKDKAIQIKGKDYILVKDRIIYFNDTYPDGCITTELVSEPESTHIIVKATVRPDIASERMFTGYSQATVGDGNVNTTAALENAETSAVGRALAMLGIGVLDSVASVDEMNKATGSAGNRYATAKQINWMRIEAQKVTGLEHGEELDKWIEDIVGMAPNAVNIKAVKDVVDQIKDQKETEYKETKVELSADEVEELKQGLKNETIPY